MLFLKSMKMDKTNSPFWCALATKSKNLTRGWIVEWPFLNPNWSLYRILLALIKSIIWIATHFSNNFEIEDRRLIGL